MQQFRGETVPDVRKTAQALGDRPVFGVGGGDLVFDDLSLFSGYEQAVRQMGLPFVQVVGNHDLNFDAPADPGSTATFRRRFGPEYYSFDRGAVHYVVLDGVSQADVPVRGAGEHRALHHQKWEVRLVKALGETP